VADDKSDRSGTDLHVIPRRSKETKGDMLHNVPAKKEAKQEGKYSNKLGREDSGGEKHKSKGPKSGKRSS